jgi:hypothetical protein
MEKYKMKKDSQYYYNGGFKWMKPIKDFCHDYTFIMVTNPSGRIQTNTDFGLEIFKHNKVKYYYVDTEGYGEGLIIKSGDIDAIKGICKFTTISPPPPVKGIKCPNTFMQAYRFVNDGHLF